MLCKFIKTNGKQCQANALEGLSYCFFHEPSIADKRKKALSSGGKQRKKPVLLEEIKINSIADVLPLLNKCINEVRTGELNSKNANTIGYLVNIVLETLKITEIDKRLKEVENAIQLREKNQKFI